MLDIAGLRRARQLPAELSDAALLDWFNQQRRAQTGGDFAPHHLQKVVAIACALRDGTGLKIASVGNPEDSEPELIRRFFDLVDKFTPQLVSWNGGGFDLPVLNQRALIHGVTAARFWDWGDDDREFKFNSYLGRYHTRHLDLMDVLVDVPAAGVRRPRRDGAAVRISRQARNGRQRGERRRAARTA